MRLCFVIIIASFFPLVVFGQTITTFAGGASSGLGDGGLATAAHLENPNGGVFDKLGNYYVASKAGNRIRKINTSGIITTIAGTGSNGYSGDGGPAISAKINLPEGLALDTSGNLYFGDAGNNRVRKINLTSGIISTIAGTGTAGYSGDGGPAISAAINNPIDLCIDNDQNIYFSDDQNNRIRKINPSGTISTYAGTGTYGYSGDGGAATAAQLWLPWGITFNSGDNCLYVADWGNKRVRKITASGVITTVAGTASGSSYNGENILAINAQIDPIKLAVDKFGNLFICDWQNYRVRQIDISGRIHTVAGNGVNGFSGDGGSATSASFNYPGGVALDSCNNLYIADASNNRVRKVTFPSCNYLGVDEPHQWREQIYAYPNPAGDALYINHDLLNLLVTNAIGQTVYMKQYYHNSSLIDLSAFPRGIYYMRMTNLDGSLTVQKVIKQ